MDVQREALQIENEMERRFSDMLHKNSQRRYLPKSLTEEIMDAKTKVNETIIKDAIGQDGTPSEDLNASNDAAPPKYGYAQIREAITERLGGTFDYTGFQSELRELTTEIPKLQREFRAQGEKYAAPDFKDSF